MNTYENLEDIKDAIVLSAQNYLELARKIKAKQDSVNPKMLLESFQKGSEGFMDFIEMCRNIKYIGINNPKLPVNFMINGKELVAELNKLDKNPEIILAFKDMILWLIDIYLDMKVSILLINYFFRIEKRDKISNSLFFIFEKSFKSEYEKITGEGEDTNLQRLIKSQKMNFPYFEKKIVLADYYSILNQKLDEAFLKVINNHDYTTKLSLTDLKSLFLRTTDANGVRQLQKLILPKLYNWIATTEGNRDNYLLLKPIFEIICTEWELGNVPATGYRNSNDYAWHKIDSMLKPDKFLKDLDSRI